MASMRRRKDRWQVQVRRKGSPQISRTFSLRADAQAWAREIELTIDRHGLPIPKRQLQSITLADLLRRYLAEVTPRKKSQVKETYRINRLLKSDLAALSLAHLGRHHIANFRDARLEDTGTQAVRHDLNLLSNLFSVAVRDWGLNLPGNPLSHLEKPPISKPRERRLSHDEHQRLLQAAAQIAPDYLPDLISWLIETSMRKGEALRITRADFDPEKQTILIREAKNGFSRRFPIGSLASKIFNARCPREGYLFQVQECLLRSHWHRATKRAGVSDLHMHDLRHEGISRLFEKGLSVPEVASISGHRDIRQLARYAHANMQLVHAKLCGPSAENLNRRERSNKETPNDAKQGENDNE